MRSPSGTPKFSAFLRARPRSPSKTRGCTRRCGRSELRLEREIEFARTGADRADADRSRRSGRRASILRRVSSRRGRSAATSTTFCRPMPSTLVIAVGDVSGKGVPAALYGAFAGELVRSRTFRRRFTTIRSSPSGVLASMNAILHERQLEEYYCVAVLRGVRLQETPARDRELGPAVPDQAQRRRLRADSAARCATRIVSRDAATRS